VASSRDTWFFTVFSARYSRVPISRLDRPSEDQARDGGQCGPDFLADLDAAAIRQPGVEQFARPTPDPLVIVE